MSILSGRSSPRPSRQRIDYVKIEARPNLLGKSARTKDRILLLSNPGRIDGTQADPDPSLDTDRYSGNGRAHGLLVELSSAPSVAPSATASASGDVCASLQTLAGSIQALSNVQPLQVGAQGVQAAVDQVETDLQPVATAASSQLETQVQALENALKAMKDTIAGASGQSPAAVAGEFQSELPAVQSAWSDLQAAADSLNCNLATATAS